MASKFSLIYDEQQNFYFEALGKDLERSLDKLISAVTDGLRTFIISVYQKKLYLVAFTSDTYAYVEIPATTIEGSGALGVDPVLLKGILKGRTNFGFSFTGNECEFKLLKGRYNGKFAGLPITIEQISTFNKNMSSRIAADNDNILSRVVLDAIKEGLLLTSVRDIYSDESLLSYLTMGKGILTVSCSDQFHLGYYRIRLKDRATFKIALPSSHFQIIDRLIEGEQVNFLIRKQNLRVEGDTFMLVLPATQVDDKQYEQVNMYMKNLEEPDFSCECDAQKFQLLTNNLLTLHTANTKLEFNSKVNSSVIDVTFNTTTGSARDALRIKPVKQSVIKAPVEPKVFANTLGLVKGKNVFFSVRKDRWLSFVYGTPSGANVSLICSLGG